MENTHGWQISEEDKKRIIDEAVCSWNKYCEALKTHNNNSFTRDEVKSLMGIVHDSGQKEIASLQSEIDRLKEEKKELMKYYDKLMEARSKLMFIAANTFNEEVQQQSNTAWQTITDITFILTRIK